MNIKLNPPYTAVDVSTGEPPPKRGGRATTILVVRDVVERFEGPIVKSLILDFADRDDMGFKKHHQNLETNDGRLTPKDAYEELLDACQYYRKWVEELRDSGRSTHFAEEMYDAVLALTFKARGGFNTEAEQVEAMDFTGPTEEERNE